MDEPAMNETHTFDETSARVAELLATYGDPKADVARLLCDDHDPAAVAFTIVDVADDGTLTPHDLTYGELHDRSQRFAAALADLGVGPGDAVATLMAKSTHLVVALLGLWRRGAVHVPLFTAFAPPALALRLTASRSKVVVVDASQRAKLDPSADMPADGGWRVVVADDADADGAQAREGDLSLNDLVDGAEPGIASEPVGGSAPLICLFTSGTTGAPKGVIVPVRALAAFRGYLEFGFDLRPDDVFWNVADPGWAYGLYYAVLGPMAAGHRSVLLHAGFSAPLTWQVATELGVTNLAAAPTVYRALRSDPAPVPAGLRLRVASSAGEPLNPDVVTWAQRELGVAIADHYGQTELGMAIINGWHPAVRRELRAGSMGHPMPGWHAVVLREDADEVAPAGTLGRVAIDLERSPFMFFEGYLDAPDRTAERFTADGRYYVTGDAASVDADGYFYFSSRDDDVIIMAGYRIGPFDVESVLVAHPAVAEAAVIGVPDALRGEVLEAFVVLRGGIEPTPELEADLQREVKERYAAHAFPRTVHFLDALPKTPSGKIQRFVLRRSQRAPQAGTSMGDA